MRTTHFLSAILLAVACTTSTTTNAPATDNRQPTTPPKAALFGPHGFDLAGMDTTVNACDDFYRYAVGTWRDTHPLPAQYSRFGRFEELAERNRDVLHTILEEDAAAAPAAPRGSAQQKIGDFYAACMNETAICRRHHAHPAELDRINSIGDQRLPSEVTPLHAGIRAALPRLARAATKEQQDDHRRWVPAKSGPPTATTPAR
jgi:putative endopeptidase